MLSEITQTVFRLFHTLAAVTMLIGILYLLVAIMNGRGVDGYIKGIAIILLAGWMGRLGGSEAAPRHRPLHHTAFVTTAAVTRAAPAGSVRACRHAPPCADPAVRI